jgi:hypothetical protein
MSANVAITFPVAGSIFLTGEAGPNDPYFVFFNARSYSADTFGRA